MAYANSTRKTVLVLNTEFPAPVLMNAIGHTVLGLIGSRDSTHWNLLDYPSPSFSVSSSISEYPVVVLRAKRSSALEKLVVQLNEAGIAHNTFIDSMLGQTAGGQQQATQEAAPGLNRIVCVALFGEEVEIRGLIKSFSVYKSSDAFVPEPAA
jgi:hypothetical protein